MKSYFRFAVLLGIAASGLFVKAPATAAPVLSGQWTCLAYGAQVNWFQNILFHPDGTYALGDARKPYAPGRYSIDSRNIVHFLGGGDDEFLGLYKGGAVYLKSRTDSGPFEKRGFNVTFKCGRNGRQ
ncbi:MAG TPA: hypothetical protein VMV82_03275 [Candidatus Dormibacteraeota bacterium]|nr:hypothetical protein [Candidatus Dormibacteraeota bacterium]